MEEADSGDGSGTPSHEIMVVVLHREYPTVGSVGITLAGGADYDTKDITVLVTNVTRLTCLHLISCHFNAHRHSSLFRSAFFYDSDQA